MIRSIVLALLLVGSAAVPALAAPLTARTSGVEAVHSGPGSRWPILGKLAKNERVYVRECTRKARWCYVAAVDSPLQGWVPGDYLIGSPAKNAVTPFEFSFNPLNPGAFAGNGGNPRRN
jgi:uncharacterized protein YraI